MTKTSWNTRLQIHSVSRKMRTFQIPSRQRTPPQQNRRPSPRWPQAPTCDPIVRKKVNSVESFKRWLSSFPESLERSRAKNRQSEGFRGSPVSNVSGNETCQWTLAHETAPRGHPPRRVSGRPGSAPPDDPEKACAKAQSEDSSPPSLSLSLSLSRPRVSNASRRRARASPRA